MASTEPGHVNPQNQAVIRRGWTSPALAAQHTYELERQGPDDA